MKRWPARQWLRWYLLAAVVLVATLCAASLIATIIWTPIHGRSIFATAGTIGVGSEPDYTGPDLLVWLPAAPRWWFGFERKGPGRWTFWIPTWIPVVAMLAWAAWEFRHAHRRLIRGTCPACGYNRVGLSIGAPCPECGRSPAKASS